MSHPVIDPAALRQAAGQAVAVAALKVLANEDRLLLLCQLSQGEMSVGDLEAALDIRQPTLSQQLAVLRAEGVVQTRRDGKRIFYSVADARLLQVLAVLHGLYCPQE
ncbi:MAG: metalloregulator ArsR/SmtB family transcription factor [Roseateles sp.]